MKTIYYYQSFVGLEKIMKHIQDVDVIIVSSIHFGRDSNKEPYIHLNDNDPNDIIFYNSSKQTLENANVNYI